ncbi:cyclic nucleotide-binding domain-containing protein [Thalassobaculum sp. OXR-137]|uniref:Crp/Fnr family transcriptional regulator n=1 Tax=Thalassobaculum sp. OXR-137 TaxID=3100173 RepID=UPI002AC98301|nr:cyclic nucleotide-binding domain-containing protein [Thalassobaculum sp. OXR-137]WPZ32962.1 cyclic nucleotide-binding domain-containing protein [Thalassobaculum sp. OXR-137]
MAAKTDSGLKVAKVFYEANETLFSEGEPPTGIFLIEEGVVEVFRASGARVSTVARLGKGDVVGELALIEGIPHTRSVRAVTPVAALKVDPGQLDQSLAESPALIRMILKRVVRKLHRTNDVAFGHTKRPA